MFNFPATGNGSTAGVDGDAVVTLLRLRIVRVPRRRGFVQGLHPRRQLRGF